MHNQEENFVDNFMNKVLTEDIQSFSMLWNKANKKERELVFSQDDKKITTYLATLIEKENITTLFWFWENCPKEAREHCFFKVRAEEGYTPLMVAVYLGNIKMLQWFWEHCPKEKREYFFFKDKDINGKNNMYFAIANENTLIEWFWEHCPQKNRFSYFFEDKINELNYIFWAIEFDNMEAIKLLWNYCPKEYRMAYFFEDKNNLGEQPIYEAIPQNNTQLLQWLWENCPKEEREYYFFKVRSEEGYTPLMVAVYWGKLKVLQWFWDHCSKEKRKYFFFKDKSTYGNNSVYFATASKNTLIEWLWEHYPQKNRFSYFFEDKVNELNYIFWAIEFDNMEAIKLLWNYCPKEHRMSYFFESRNNSGEQPIHKATFQNNLQLLQWFWEHCPKEARKRYFFSDSLGRGILTIATACKYEAIIDWLWPLWSTKFDNLSTPSTTEIEKMDETLMGIASDLTHVTGNVIHMQFINAMGYSSLPDDKQKMMFDQSEKARDAYMKVHTQYVKSIKKVVKELDKLPNVDAKDIEIQATGNEKTDEILQILAEIDVGIHAVITTALGYTDIPTSTIHKIYYYTREERRILIDECSKYTMQVIGLAAS